MAEIVGRIQPKKNPKKSPNAPKPAAQRRTAAARAWETVDQIRESMAGRKMRSSTLLIREGRRG